MPTGRARHRTAAARAAGSRVTDEEGKGQVSRLGRERKLARGVEDVRAGRRALVQVVPGGLADVRLPSRREQRGAGPAGQVVVGGGHETAVAGIDVQDVDEAGERGRVGRCALVQAENLGGVRRRARPPGRARLHGVEDAALHRLGIGAEDHRVEAGGERRPQRRVLDLPGRVLRILVLRVPDAAQHRGPCACSSPARLLLPPSSAQRRSAWPEQAQP